MKYKLLSVLLLAPLISSANDEQAEFLSQFVQGNFVLIGKTVNSDQTYHGSVNITRQDNVLTVKRKISNNEVTGTAAIESAEGVDTKVLRIRFPEDNLKYEQTCLIASDLNNYPRISCYVYPEKNRQIEQPGYEVLFHAS